VWIMIKIKKVLIAIFIVLAFFAEEAICASLRPPMSFSGDSQDKEITMGLTVAEKIRQLQATGVKPETINRKIKKEFEETEYHLQECVRMSDSGSFYVRLGSDEYLEITNAELRVIDKVTFEQGHRILVKVINKSYTKTALIAEVEKVTEKLQKKLKRPPNMRETAKAMPSLRTSRDPAGLLYKYFQTHGLSPYDHGISSFSGKAHLVVKGKFAFAGTRIFLPSQLSGRVEISAEKTPISNETKIDLVDRKNPKNRLTIEHIKGAGILRLTHIQPSGQTVTADMADITGKTSVTLTLNPVFSDFYDTVFSIPLAQSEDRLKAAAKHLRNRKFGVSYRQEEKEISFHGRLVLPYWYKTHPRRIEIYRDRGNWARFILFEDVVNPDNITGYEWRDARIIPLEAGAALEASGSVISDGEELSIYGLHKSDAFSKGFDEPLNKGIEVGIATPDDTWLSERSIGTGKFAFRVKRNVEVFSIDGHRSRENIARDDRSMYPIKIVRLNDKREIKINYRNPDVQGEFTIEGLAWEDNSPVVLKGSSDYEGNRGYFNISTIIEMVRQGLLKDIKASKWLLETFGFYEGHEDENLTNPIRSYKIETTASGKRFLVEDVLVDPKTFLPWHGAKNFSRSNKTRTGL